MAGHFLSRKFVLSSLNQLGKQWSLWLAVLSNPLSVVSADDLDSEEVLLKVYKFFLFICAIVFLLRIPFFDIFLGVDMRAPLNLLVLFILNAVSIAVFVLILYGCAKILLGRGSLRSTTITGIYLTAFWPFFMAASYLSGISLHIRENSTNRVSEWWFLEPVTGLATIALLLFLFFYLIIKSVPAIKYVHGIGNIRAIIICGFGYVLAFEVQNWLVLRLLFELVKLTA